MFVTAPQSPAIDGGGFGPVSPSCYGIGYTCGTLRGVVDLPPPPPPLVLSGHAASLTQVDPAIAGQDGFAASVMTFKVYLWGRARANDPDPHAGPIWISRVRSLARFAATARTRRPAARCWFQRPLEPFCLGGMWLTSRGLRRARQANASASDYVGALAESLQDIKAALEATK